MSKGLWAMVILLVAGCSSLPGLGVLTGEDSGAPAEQLVEAAELVMADKGGFSDPSLMAAADRIEAASNIADIIEIRRDDADNAFNIHLVFPPPPQDPQDVQANFTYYDTLRRVVEMSWQGTIHESDGSGVLRVIVLYPLRIQTLDDGGQFVGQILVRIEIERAAALAYLANRPHSFSDFRDLILAGTLLFDEPPAVEIYDGIPNHPMFMTFQPPEA